MKDGGSKLALIFGCVIAAVVIVFVVGLLVVLCKYKRRMLKRLVSQTISSSVLKPGSH
jgi:hypothetical protein